MIIQFLQFFQHSLSTTKKFQRSKENLHIKERFWQNSASPSKVANAFSNDHSSTSLHWPEQKHMQAQKEIKQLQKGSKDSETNSTVVTHEFKT